MAETFGKQLVTQEAMRARIRELGKQISKGSRNNNFTEFAPRFEADWVDLREQNRRRSKVHVEDFASEDRLKMA